jgi:hypothetical protein
VMLEVPNKHISSWKPQSYQWFWCSSCQKSNLNFLHKLENLGARIKILAEINFIGLFDNLGWCLRFPTNKFQVENHKVIGCFYLATVRNLSIPIKTIRNSWGAHYDFSWNQLHWFIWHFRVMLEAPNKHVSSWKFQNYQWFWCSSCQKSNLNFLHKLKNLGARIMILAKNNFIGLFDNLEWCLRFPTNRFQAENPKIISCFDVAAVRNPIYTYWTSKKVLGRALCI